MCTLGLQSVIRKKRRYFGKSGGIVFPNILCRDFKSNSFRKKLVTGITYMPATEGFICLSVVQDIYNNEIIAYSLSSRNDMTLVLDTLRKIPVAHGAVLHSDQGFQYTHKAYQEKLAQLQMTGSHSRRGNCLDNACVESFFSHLKTETSINNHVLIKEEVMASVEKYILFYNTERLQKRLGQLSPVEYREKLAA